MTFQLVDDGDAHQALAGRPPPGTEVLLPLIEDQRPRQRGSSSWSSAGAGERRGPGRPRVPTFRNSRSSRFRFDTLGARRFGEATTANVDRRFAIVLDNKIISAPVIKEPIIGGSGDHHRQLHQRRGPRPGDRCCAPAPCRRRSR